MTKPDVSEQAELEALRAFWRLYWNDVATMECCGKGEHSHGCLTWEDLNRLDELAETVAKIRGED